MKANFSVTLFAFTTLAVAACSSKKKPNNNSAPTPQESPAPSPQGEQPTDILNTGNDEDITTPMTEEERKAEQARISAEAKKLEETKAALIGSWVSPQVSSNGITTAHYLVLKEKEVTFGYMCADEQTKVIAEVALPYEVKADRLVILGEGDSSVKKNDISCIIAIGKGELPFVVAEKSLKVTLKGNQERVFQRAQPQD